MKKSYLNGKTIIITGVSGGLGFAIAKRLINDYGAKIIGICRNEEKLLKNIESNNISKDNFSYRLFDVTKKEKWQEFYNFLIENNIKVDGLINNAGIMLPFKKFGSLSDEQIEQAINVNLIAYINSTKILLPLIKENKGHITNIISSAGLCPIAGESIYCATKFALKGFTDTLRVEYKNEVSFTGVYPGFIATDILQNQEKGKNSKTVNKMMMPVDKASKKICRAISKKKKSIVVGADGKALNFFGKLFPRTFPFAVKKVFKLSKEEIFEDLFNN